MAAERKYKLLKNKQGFLTSIKTFINLAKGRQDILFTIYFCITLALLFFSNLFIFSLPYPLVPRTSIGLINLLTIFIALISLTRLKFTMQFFRSLYGGLIDLLVVLFFLANALSLAVAQRIENIIPFRLLCSGLIVYYSLRLWLASEKHRKTFIHILGAVAVFVATLSLMQVFFPDIFNTIADNYFGGQLSYGLELEYQRGRLLHWGSVILIFPFYYVSIILLKPINTFQKLTYSILGSIALVLSMVMSNFRWTFLVFLLVSGLFVKYIVFFQYASKRWILRIFIFILLLLALGLIMTKSFFGYNLLDRFLLVNRQRDVTESLGRTMLFNQGINVFLSSPITGAGTGNYYSLVEPFQHLSYFSIFDQFKLILVPIASHNEFLTILAETGILGFISWLLIVYSTAKHLLVALISWRKYSSVNVLFLLALSMSFLSYILYTLFENIFPQNIVYLLAVVGIVHWWFSSLNKKAGV